MFATNTGPSPKALARVRSVMKQSPLLRRIVDFLATFCCEGGFILVEHAVPYHDPNNPHYVGRCLQHAYETAGGSCGTRPHVFFEAIKLRFADLPAFYEMFEVLILDTVEGIQVEYPTWSVVAEDQQAWHAQGDEVCVCMGPLGELIKTVLREILKSKAPRAVRTDT